MSMISQKQDAIWISNPEAQGSSENDWVEYQAEIDGKLTPVQKKSGTDATSLVCWDDEVTNGQDFVIRQGGTPYQSVANVLSSQEIEIDRIYALDLLTYDNITYTVSQAHEAKSFTFSPDGTKMYLLEYDSVSNPTRSVVYEYDLSTAFDLSSMVHNGITLDVTSQLTNADGNNRPAFVEISDDGTKLYVGEYYDNTVYQYRMSTVFELNTATYNNEYYVSDGGGTTPPGGGVSTPIFGLTFKPDGSKMYGIMANSNAVYQYTLSTVWDITTASYDTGYYINIPYTYDFNEWKGHITDDGTKLYVFDRWSRAHRYTLSTPWDLLSATLDYDISTTGDWLYDMKLVNNETKFYALFEGQAGQEIPKIEQYTVPTEDNVTYRTENIIDISDFSLGSSPEYVFTGFPQMKVCMEDTPLRCISRDTPMTIQAVNADQVQVTYSDTLDQTLAANDLVVIDSGDVSVTSVVDSGTTTAGGDKIWNVNLPLSGTTPTFIHIKDRSTLMPYSTTLVAGDVYQYSVSVSTTGEMSHTFPSQDIRTNPKRAVQIAAIGDEGTTVTNLTTNLWKT